MVKLPEPDYFTTAQLSKRWGVSEEDVLQYAVTGQLRTSVVSKGWYMESGYYDCERDDERQRFTVPDDEFFSRNRLHWLCVRSISEVLDNGVCDNPSLDVEQGLTRFWRCYTIP